MAIRRIFRVSRRIGGFLIALFMVCAPASALAETATAQAVLTFIVLPYGNHTTSSQAASDTDRRHDAYDSDTLTSRLEQAGSRFREVWFAI